jgi:hypothetical protein
LVALHNHHTGHIYEGSVLLNSPTYYQYLHRHALKTRGGLGKENEEKIHIQGEHEVML